MLRKEVQGSEKGATAHFQPAAVRGVHYIRSMIELSVHLYVIIVTPRQHIQVQKRSKRAATHFPWAPTRSDVQKMDSAYFLEYKRCNHSLWKEIQSRTCENTPTRSERTRTKIDDEEHKERIFRGRRWYLTSNFSSFSFLNFCLFSVMMKNMYIFSHYFVMN